MRSLVDSINWQPLTLDGVNLEDVQCFVYLRSTIMPSGQGTNEVDRRIGAARSAFMRLKLSLWGRREISTAMKGCIYQAIVRTILLYGCERGYLERLTFESLKCSTTIAFVTFYDSAASIVCQQLLYVVAWTSVLFHSSYSSAVSDCSGTRLDAWRESTSAMYFSPLHFLTGENVSVGSWRRGPA